MIEARQESFLRDGNWKRIMISTPTIKGGVGDRGGVRGLGKTAMACSLPALRRRVRLRVRHPFSLRTEVAVQGLLFLSRLRGRDRGARPGLHGARRPLDRHGACARPQAWLSLRRAVVAIRAMGQGRRAICRRCRGSAKAKGVLHADARPAVRNERRRAERRNPDVAAGGGTKRGHIPPQGVLLVASADIQGGGIWYEVLAVARTRETWVVDAGLSWLDRTSGRRGVRRAEGSRARQEHGPMRGAARVRSTRWVSIAA